MDDSFDIESFRLTPETAQALSKQKRMMRRSRHETRLGRIAAALERIAAALEGSVLKTRENNTGES
jgi:hypothetical protein